MTEVTAYIGLGSNLQEPRAQLRSALEALAELPQGRLAAVSSLYRSAPMGPQDQPDYLNAVARIETALEPEPLLDTLQAIERAQGRVRTRRWGPRTLDLDLLLYGERIIDSERLSVPHPGLAERDFVLCPLAELDAGLEIPGQGPVQQLLACCPSDGLTRVGTCPLPAAC
ncbi:MAG TPA: 2-amino-4-hydroxy-6-hydroxymethyldihydropteridine diphosphokinase [Gammaproteobacteria bacterium]|nr:2-amino-4-hydroxy-6-hydroxymethyldihydropteridine diphosphokinase [Gammaproteobacteria bacterium]